jgi:hypothetical protein
MQRSILKPHASLFAGILRMSDPLATVVVGVGGYVAYLRSLALPEHYWLFLIVGALSVAALFPLFRLYEPQRGISIVVELRSSRSRGRLTGSPAGPSSRPESGDAFSVSGGDLAERGFAATVVLRFDPDCCACWCDDAAANLSTWR